MAGLLPRPEKSGEGNRHSRQDSLVRPVLNLLRAFLAGEVLPHACAEERTVTGQPGVIRTSACWCRHWPTSAVTWQPGRERLGEPARPAAAAAISALFASHVAKEDNLLLPALERSGADLAALLARGPV